VAWWDGTPCSDTGFMFDKVLPHHLIPLVRISDALAHRDAIREAAENVLTALDSERDNGKKPPRSIRLKLACKTLQSLLASPGTGDQNL